MTSKLELKLLKCVKRASKQFGLLEPNDRVMVCMSGGKDSYAMLELLMLLRTRLPFPISLVAVNLDQGHPGFPREVLPNYFEEKGVEYKIVSKDTLSIVKEKVPEGATYCALCARLRRGILYNTAVELGCNKIALGHHRDDVIETALLNLLYGGKLSSMPPKFRSDDGRNTVIRPLLYAPEEWIIEYAEEKQFPIIPCNLCGSQDGLHRQKVKALIKELNDENSFVKISMMGALANVSPSHLLDEKLWALTGAHQDADLDSVEPDAQGSNAVSSGNPAPRDDWPERNEPDPLDAIEGGGGCGGSLTSAVRADFDLSVERNTPV